MKVPPGNWLHGLAGDLRRYHTVRARTINTGSCFGSKVRTRPTCGALTIIEELKCCRPIAHRPTLARCSSRSPSNLLTYLKSRLPRYEYSFPAIERDRQGCRAVSADTALLLEALTAWDAQIWLTLQAKWDLWHAMKARGHKPKVRPLRKTA